MKNQVYFGIAIRIVMLFTIGSLMTFLPEYLRTFFGDTPCAEHCYGIYKYWNWGSRHYWYFWMMVLLFILSSANVIISIAKLVQKHYPNL